MLGPIEIRTLRIGELPFVGSGSERVEGKGTPDMVWRQKKKKGKDRALTSGLKCSFGHEEAPIGQETPPPPGCPALPWTTLGTGSSPGAVASDITDCSLPQFPPLQSEDQPSGTSLLGLRRTVSEIIHGKG